MFLGYEVGPGGSVDAHVIGEGDGVIAQAGGAADEVFRLAGAAEEGEGRTGMEFGENGSGRSSGLKRLLVDSFEEPVMRWLVSEAEEG